MAQYKTVAGPVGLTISQKDSYTDAIKQYAQIINRESVDGWKFHSMYEVPVTKVNGCLATLFFMPTSTVRFNMLVFIKEDPVEEITATTTPAISAPRQKAAHSWRCEACNRMRTQTPCEHCGHGKPANAAPNTVPYRCGKCGYNGPYNGNCPSCGSSIKFYTR